MRKQLIFILVIVFILVSDSTVSAQLPEFQPLSNIYRIKSANCTQEPKSRIQTGFRIKGQIGIVTALHGVVGCSSITAQSEGTGKTFTNLVLNKVDISRDMALLSSADLVTTSPDGFEILSHPAEQDIVDLQLIGYPWGKPNQEPLYDILFAQESVLSKLLPNEPVDYMKKRRSPGLDVRVYSLEANLVPGHSGAPLLTTSQRILGVGNGGLDLGRVGKAWAIPMHMVNWKAASSANQELKRVAQFRPGYIFSFATPDDYVSPRTQLTQPNTWTNVNINATFIKIDEGPYQFGSTYVEANKGLRICYEYSGDLCGWEAFSDEIVHNEWRGTGELPDFWIMEAEVSNAQYDACVLAGVCKQPDAKVRPPGAPSHPVRLGEVKYALDFASWSCGRLPTELEWEKAARGPDGLLYPWGNNWEPGRANYCGDECAKQPQTNIKLMNDEFIETSPVIGFEEGRSPYGLYHMAGNVREWTIRDKNRPGISHDYMMKGGSFYDFPDVLRTADRLRSPIDRDGTVTAGFRVVRDSVDYSCN